MRRLGQLLNLVVLAIVAGIAWYEANHPRPQPGERAPSGAGAGDGSGEAEQSALDQIVSQVGTVVSQVVERAPNIGQVLEKAQGVAGDVLAAAESMAEQAGVSGRGQGDAEPAGTADTSAERGSEGPQAGHEAAESTSGAADAGQASGDTPGAAAPAASDAGMAPVTARPGVAGVSTDDASVTAPDSAPTLSQVTGAISGTVPESGSSTPAPLDSTTTERLGDAAAATTAPTAPPESESAAASGPTLPSGAVAGSETGECPADYPIKGNASSRIYHEPGRPSYEQTRPEFCFASVEDAERAGFVPPKS